MRPSRDKGTLRYGGGSRWNDCWRVERWTYPTAERDKLAAPSLDSEWKMTGVRPLRLAVAGANRSGSSALRSEADAACFNSGIHAACERGCSR